MGRNPLLTDIESGTTALMKSVDPTKGNIYGPGGEIFIFGHFRSFSVFSGFFPVFFVFFLFRSPWAPWASMFNGFSLFFIVFLLIFDDFHDFHDFEYLLRRSWGSMSFFFFALRHHVLFVNRFSLKSLLQVIVDLI